MTQSVARSLCDSWTSCLTRLLTTSEEDIERVSMLKEDISSTACELTMLILSLSIAFNATCLTVRFSALTRDIDIAILSVRPSVCPWRSGIRWKRIVIVFFHQPNHSSFINIKHLREIPTGSPPAWCYKYRWGIKISQFSTNKSLYLANDTKYRHDYYGRRVGTRMRSIKWCHFQWPWTNPNPVFKVTPLFDAKYLTNGYRYGHSYHRRRIGNRTQAFKWHQFQWSWVTFDPHFKVTILFNVK